MDTLTDQCEVVLRHLISKKTITTIDAIEKYRITRLAARIYDLRQAGHKIFSWKEGRITRYSLND